MTGNKGKLENCKPTEGKKEENMSMIKELAVKQRIRNSFQEER